MQLRFLFASICLMLQHLHVRPAHALPSASVGAVQLRASCAPRLVGASTERGKDFVRTTCVGAGRAGRAGDRVACMAGTSPESRHDATRAGSRCDAQGLALRGGGAGAKPLDLKVPTFRQVTVHGPQQTRMLAKEARLPTSRCTPYCTAGTDCMRQQLVFIGAFSGALAGAVTDLSMFPLEKIKTRLQVENYPRSVGIPCPCCTQL
jgi:hypothetical protein